MDGLDGRGAAEIGRGIETGEIDPVDLALATLDAIETHAFGPRIYARATRDRALAEARAAAHRARTGTRRSPLDGVPISWKDLVDTAGIRTEAGSALLSGRVPIRDAAVLRRATDAGLVCLGKTHMTELAFSGLGLNPSTASPPCIGNHDAVSGGSSSGAATSVAFGLAAGAIGSDTGGSVRVPACWNDLVGLKTTHGSLPMEGVVPLCPKFDTLGPLARNVEDAAALWSVMAAAPAPDLRGARLDGVRLLALETCAMDDVAPEVEAAFREAVARLEAGGAQVEWRAVPSVAPAMAQSATVFAAEAYGVWRDIIEAAPEKMYPPVRERFRGGAGVSAPDYVAAWRLLDECRRAYLDDTAAFDAVILPTSPILPPDRARLETEEAYFVSSNLMTLRNTRIGNLMGLPGLTLPTGRPSTGVLFQTPPGTEARLLRLGAAAEAVMS